MNTRNLIIATAMILSLPGGAATADTTTGTTVIIHGFQLSGTIPDWPYHMAEAIRIRAGGGRIFEIDEPTGALVDCTHSACGPQAAGGESIIVYDWATASLASGTGFSEGAAEALVADLVTWNDLDPALVDLGRLHLIGHSRGAVVASETAERLMAAGRPAPEQITSLDPHDTGAFALTEEDSAPEGLWDDLDVNLHHPDYGCGPALGEPSGVCSWLGVGFHDNYWRDQDGFPCFFDPDGKLVPGVADFDASSLDAFCHSDVHAWYHFTIDTDAVTHPETGNPPGVDWFDPAATTCTSAARSAPLARAIDGYNSSRVGGAAVRCPTDEFSQQRVLFDFGLPEGLVNGDFEKEPAGSDLAGWRFHGGGGTGSVTDDGDRLLLLDAGSWQRHGRFLIPRGTIGARVCFTVVTADVGDLLTVTLEQDGGSRVLLELDPVTVAGWQCLTAPVLALEGDRPATLLLSVHDNGVPPLARIGVDDIGLIVGIFFDDFESGDTSSWGVANP